MLPAPVLVLTVFVELLISLEQSQVITIIVLELLLGVISQISVVSWSQKDLGNVEHRHNSESLLHTSVGG